MPKILMSACLLGQKVRYDGGDCLQNHGVCQQRCRLNFKNFYYSLLPRYACLLSSLFASPKRREANKELEPTLHIPCFLPVPVILHH